MSIVKMKKIALTGLTAEREAVLMRLQQLGCVQIEEYPPETVLAYRSDAAERQTLAQLESIENELELVRAALASLDRNDKRKKPMFAKVPEVSFEGLSHLTDHDELLESCGQIRSMEAAILEAKANKARIDAQIDALEPWKELAIAVEDLETSAHCVLELGTVPLTGQAQMQDDFVGQRIGVDRERGYWLVAMLREEEEDTRKRLLEIGYAKATLPVSQGTPKSALNELRRASREYDEERAFLEERIKEYLPDRARFEMLIDSLCSTRDRCRAATQMLPTQQTYSLSGWVPAKLEGKLDKQLQSVTEALHIEWLDAEEGDLPPTYAQNPAAVRPFESITNMFSAPLYGADIDPNKIMMPFYAMFFGMMVSDAAYGILLTVVSFIALYVLKMRGGMRPILGVLMFGGIMTLFWGTLFGSWFAIEGIEPILFAPMNSPIEMLILCYSLGGIHVLFGLGIKAYMLFRDGDPYTAIFDPICWMLVILGVPFVALGMILAPVFTQVGAIISLVGVAGILLCSSKSLNPIKRLVSGLGSLYGVTGYLSDILSYSRLFAMGLATGVIGMVFNLLAGMLMGSPVGFVFGIIILVVGHVFNLAVNTLGAYVHACRLQYIEFFGKFYNGGGRLFDPLSVKTKYVQVDSARG